MSWAGEPGTLGPPGGPAEGCVLDSESAAYPRELLKECQSALLLFCSGRMGSADGHWVRVAFPLITDVACVDWDEKTLDPFQAVYPAEWSYVRSDAFGWAREQTRRWDIVSADVPSQWADRLPETLPLWCALADRYVTVTWMADTPIPSAPDGWLLRDVRQRAEWNGRVYCWLILERKQA